MEYLWSDSNQWVQFNGNDFLNEIRKTLILQTAAILQLQNDIKNLSCNGVVEVVEEKKVIGPGQGIIDITPPQVFKFPMLKNKPAPLRMVIKDEPKKEVEKSPRSYYKVDDGYFPIVGTGVGWKIDGNKIVNKSGYDLEKSLPIRLDKDRSIIGYVVKMTSQGIQPILVYKGIDQFGEDRILEGGIYFWRKFFK